MKLSMYFHYTSRSLWRGGQRTVLAFFCVAVGVMAIVALQLVGLMINNALTANVRDANGGDISVTAGARPFNNNDLNFFAQLKQDGTISNYTALANQTGSFSNAISLTDSFSILLVDPTNFPIVTPPLFNNPTNGKISTLLNGKGVIVDQSFIDQYHKHLGDTFNIHVSTGQQNTQLLTVQIVGIVTDTGVLAQRKGVMLVAQTYYQQAAPNAPMVFDTVDITTASQDKTDAAVNRINTQYPLATTQTAADALKSRQTLVDGIKKFLEIAGLLALLIGGVGIINTMQVLLSRRKIEIAMLKTTGYKRKDLYLLFGLEAGLLGLIGGILGSAAAIGTSYLVRAIVQQGFGLLVPFQLDWPTIAGGVLIGLSTALIFGLMPIVQAANIRPLNVIRELSENSRVGSLGLTALLLLILSVLFCIMSVIILNDVGLGIGAVYGTFVFLLLLSGFFTLITLLVSILPVPERLDLKFIALIVGVGIVSALITLALPTFGYLLLVLTGLGFLTAVMPRSWKVNTRMALRNIGRQRARTTTTLLALFVGIFTIGLILVLGQNLRDSINNTVGSALTYNVVTAASGPDADALQTQINNIPGVSNYTHHYLASTVPVAINGVPLSQVLQGVPQNGGINNLGRAGVVGLLSSLEGYDVANGNLPTLATTANGLSGITISAGRNLQASDAGTNNILLPSFLTALEPLEGKVDVGSTITVASIDGQSTVTLTVVGIYKSSGFNLTLGQIYGLKNTVQALSPHGVAQSIFYLKVDSAKVNQALAKIGQIAPTSGSFSLVNIGDFIDQFLNYLILVLVTIASLSLLAGVIIIANAVALAMLERRRELGILKSVGYTSRTVLGEVLIENAIIGGLGALLAMLLVTFVTNLLGQFVFKSNFSVNGFVVIGLILGSALMAVIVALLVAWGSVRVRPLAVLRYE